MSVIFRKHERIGVADRRNILLMNRSLLTGFLFFPLGISVHIYTQFSRRKMIRSKNPTSFTFSRTLEDGESGSVRNCDFTYHVAVSIKCFDSCKKFLVIP